MKRFYNLKFGEKFTLEGKILQKESPFRAVTSIGRRFESLVWPWTKVRLVDDRGVAHLCAGLRKIETIIYGSGLNVKRPFSSPPPLGERFLRECALTYEPHKDDNRTGPSA